MILISAGLVLTAIVLLIAGFVLAKPFLVMWSIAVSVLSAVFLVIGALLRRHELFPGGDAGASQPLPPKGPMPAGPLAAPHGVPNQTPGRPSAPQQMVVRHGMQQAPAAPTQPRRGPVAGPATAAAARRGALDPEAIVLVIPGRKRYHVAGCRQLAGRDHEELTYEEAREEGFTPCTTCLPADPASGPQTRETPPGVRRPDESLTVSRESGPTAGAREPGAHEATARFTAPYQPVQPTAPSGGRQAPGTRSEPQRSESPRPESSRPGSQRSEPQRPETQRPEHQRPGAESPQARFEASRAKAEPPAAPVTGRDSAPGRPEASEARRESAASRQEAQRSPQEPVVSVARPYIQSPEPQARPQESASPPARPAEQPARPAGIQLPKIPEIPHAASEATSWFSRDAAGQASQAAGQKTSAAPAGSADAPAKPEPVRAESAKAASTASGSATSGSSGASVTAASASSSSRAEAPEPAEAEPTRPANPRPAKAEPAKSGPAEAGSATAGPAKAGSAGGKAHIEAASGGKASAEAETATAGRDTSPEPSGSGREAPAEGDTPKPVEPAETAPGRAGPQVAADSTSAKPAPATATLKAPAVKPEAVVTGTPADAPSRDDRDGRDGTDAPDDRGDDTSPGGIPAIKDGTRPAAQGQEADGETVTTIAGTRRFHDADCPLVKGASAGGSGIETVSRAEAEKAGLTDCPICRNDRRT
ncbi:hypothetical protein ACSDR0_05515 [Streptosporangium sp. G11]|uniref:hypothetical protein n=1 Tax=Streptosporangium sp. G11 TaxID=3436926 RepID=UPI003EB6B0A1